jgi:pullulanase
MKNTRFLILFTISIIACAMSATTIAGDVTFEPADPIPGQGVTVTYDNWLRTEPQVIMHWSYAGYSVPATDTSMSKQTDGSWKTTVTVPPVAVSSFDAAFHNGAGHWDNNGGSDYHADLGFNNQLQVSKLGADYTPQETTFAIWSPDSADVVLTLDGTDYPCQRASDFDGYMQVYGVKVPGDHKLKEYRFKINGIAVRDPYGTMVKAGTDSNIVMDTAAIQPGAGWAAVPSLTEREDAVIYEVHVRDFTLDDSSGVSADKKGKFLGMVETGTSYQGLKTGIDHLKELGVTHVQIMPIYDFATPQYNWGYDPVNYNVPEEQYSLTPNDYENRVRELQTMVNGFHKNGIRVIMDVVYNHTFNDDRVFEDISMQYYTGSNDSGTGNGINSNVPMVSRMIRDSLEYWVNQYHVDGFRFDLIGIFHYDEVRKWGEYLNQRFPGRKLLVYGEPWNGYWQDDPIPRQRVRYGTTPAVASGHVGVFNGNFREAIKGDNDKTGRGYMFNSGDLSWNIEVGSRGGIRYEKSTNPLQNLWDSMFAYDPEQSINYISAHDNFCLWDKIQLCLADKIHADYDKNGNFDPLYGIDFNPAKLGYADRVDRFGMGIVLTSQGIPFIHAGDEMRRTKMVDDDCVQKAHNSYNAPDKCNVIRWNWKAENADLFDYYKDLIAMRRAHPGFRLNTWDEIDNWMQSYRDGKVVISQIDAGKNGDEWDDLLVVYNPGNSYNVDLPAGAWTKVFDINGAVESPNLTGSAKAEGTAVTVFAKQDGPPPPWQRTVVYIYGKTQPGQDMFIRGGLDHAYAAGLGRNCTQTNYQCAIPIRYLNLENATTAPWKQGDNYLDWYGAENGQGAGASGSPLDWTTTANDAHPNDYLDDGYGKDGENHWGAHYWKFDVEMDCSKTANGWFELKSFVSKGPEWEHDVSQPGTPYKSGNHFAQCGKLNVFRRNKSQPVTIENLQ